MDEKEMSMREALNLALDQAMASDDRVFLLGEDIADPGGGISQVTKGLSTTHGIERVRDTPISEAAIVGQSATPPQQQQTQQQHTQALQQLMRSFPLGRAMQM